MRNSTPVSLTTVLLVDDLDICRSSTGLILRNFGYAVQSAESAEMALARFDPLIHDVVVTDNVMPGMAGEEMARIIKRRSPATPVLMYAAMPPDDPSGLDSVVLKPASAPELKEALDRLLNHPRRETLPPHCQPTATEPVEAGGG